MRSSKGNLKCLEPQLELGVHREIEAEIDFSLSAAGRHWRQCFSRDPPVSVDVQRQHQVSCFSPSILFILAHAIIGILSWI